jgi:alpha-galactosidase
MNGPTAAGWWRFLFFMAIAAALSAAAIAQKTEGLAATPPMGWNSWNRFGCNVDERLIRETADAMVATGMRDAGYVFVTIDDCWHGTRDADGFIRPDPERFPAGMKALADAVHARGLKLGIYSDAGGTTCAGRPGSRGHEYQDALTFARWGVDYLKYDWCDTDGLAARGAYATMRDALAAAGRPIVLSICEWGDNQPWTWGKEIGHLWRTTGDIHPCWDCEVDHGGWSSWGVLRILDKQKGLRSHAGPGHWNDPDMLEVGNGMTESEDRAHLSLWAMLAAPLIAGNDLRAMSDATRRILTNREVIAIDQDELGIQGFRWRAEGELEIWARPLAGGAWAVCLLNRGAVARKVVVEWSDEPIADDLSGRRASFETMEYLVRNVWGGGDLGSTRAALAAEVAGHDVLMVRLTPVGGEQVP